MKTAKQVKDDFTSTGTTITAWAKKHGFNRVAVHRVISGDCRALRGSGHKIAVLLGMKDGKIIEQ